MGGAFVSAEHDPALGGERLMDPGGARVFDAWSGADALPACVGLDVTEQVWLSRRTSTRSRRRRRTRRSRG
jgi:hypothetical protein